MEFVGWWFGLLMCVTGALVATVADAMGRRIGKKKHTFMGLRPRKTAALFTALAGFFIPAITIGVLAVASTDVRRMLAEGSRASEKLDKIQGKIRVSEARLEESQRRYDLAEKDRSRLEVEAEKLTQAAKQLRSANSGLRNQNQIVERSLSASQRSLKDSQVRAKRAEFDLRASRASLNRIKADLADRQKSLRATVELNAEAEQRLKEINEYASTLDIKIQGLEKTQKELTSQKNQLERNLESIVDRTSKEADAYRKQIEESKKELEGVNKDLNSAKDDLALTRSLAREFENSLNDVRRLPLTYSIRGEVARLVLPAGASQEEARQGVNRLFAVASQSASKRGAKEQGPYNPADMFDIYDANGRLQLSVEEQKERLYKRVIGQRDPVLLIARSRINCFEGESVRCVVEAYNDVIVYREGDVIADTKVNGERSDQEIVDTLDEFLKNNVSPKAIKDGIVPIVGSDQPIGEIEPGVVSQMIQDIKAFRRIVRVQAIAASNTRRSDRLRLLFKLR